MAKEKNKGKKDINAMKVATGEVPKAQITSLDQFFGYKDARYNTLDEAEYLKQINAMHLVDLYGHAVKLGIPPYKERDRLTKKLMNLFQIYSSGFKRPVNEFEGRNKGDNVPQSVKDFMAQGR